SSPGPTSTWFWCCPSAAPEWETKARRRCRPRRPRAIRRAVVDLGARSPSRAWERSSWASRSLSRGRARSRPPPRRTRARAAARARRGGRSVAVALRGGGGVAVLELPAEPPLGRAPPPPCVVGGLPPRRGVVRGRGAGRPPRALLRGGGGGFPARPGETLAFA